MGLGIDVCVVLRAMADHPDAFPALRSDLDLLTHKLLVKQLKDKQLDLLLLRRLNEVAGEENLKAVFDAFSDAELIGLLKKVDAYSELAKKDADLHAARSHVFDLLNGSASLSQAPTKPAKASKSAGARTEKKANPATSEKKPQAKIGKVLGSKVHSGENTKAKGPKKTV